MSKPIEDCCSVTPPDSTPVLCPACRTKGSPVGSATLRSLVAPPALDRLASLDGFRFCATPDCDVAYFQPESGQQISRADVPVRIGQKETHPSRLIGYCFDHTAGEIEYDVQKTGSSLIPKDIGAKCKQGLDHCEETNPQGTCCLGNVRAVMKAAQAAQAVASESKQATEEGEVKSTASSKGLWVVLGSILAAVVASACCWLPLLLLSLGVSAAGVSSKFEPMRPYFLTLTGVLLAAGFYFAYRPAQACSPESGCEEPRPRMRSFQRLMLWAGTLMVIAFSFLPKYIAQLSPADDTPAQSAADGESLSFYVEGMSCEGCIVNVRESLKTVPGVLNSSVEYPSGQVTVQYAADQKPSPGQLAEAIDQAGYTFKETLYPPQHR